MIDPEEPQDLAELLDGATPEDLARALTQPAPPSS